MSIKRGGGWRGRLSPALSSSWSSAHRLLSMRSFAIAAALLPSVYAATYSVADTYVGTDFLNSWTHEAIADPTHGRV